MDTFFGPAVDKASGDNGSPSKYREIATGCDCVCVSFSLLSHVVFIQSGDLLLVDAIGL